MASTFCRIVFSWSTDNSVSVIKYRFFDISLESERENFIHSAVTDNLSAPLHLVKENNSPDCCCAHITCCNPTSVQINGISILSESRTLEISNNLEGYIDTIRGQRVKEDSSDVGEKDLESQLYKCSYIFANPQTDFQVKFMSLGIKDNIIVPSMTMNVLQQVDVIPKKALGTFDMNKLRNDIAEMGDTVSAKALDFLKTMEVFEQNKSKNIGGLLEHLEKDIVPMPSQLVTQQSTDNIVPSKGHLDQGLSSIMESVLGSESLKSLMKKKPENGDQSNGNNNIYSMLQMVCGEVTKMRKPPSDSKHNNEEESMIKTRMDKNNSSSCESDSQEKQNLVINANLLVQVENRLEAVKAEMKMEIQAAKEEVINTMNKMNEKMEQKMDLVLKLLQNNQLRENVSDTVTDTDR